MNRDKSIKSFFTFQEYHLTSYNKVVVWCSALYDRVSLIIYCNVLSCLVPAIISEIVNGSHQFYQIAGLVFLFTFLH